MLTGQSGATKAQPEARASAGAVELEFADADVYTVQVDPLGRTVLISGTLDPARQAFVKSTVSEALLQCHVRGSERVVRGAVIAEVDTTDARSRLAAALADQGERHARQSIAARNRDTNLRLLQQSFISQSAFDQLQSTFQSTEAAVRWADAQVAMARKAIDDAQVRAPLSGTVAMRYVNPRERVTADAPILSIVDLSNVEVEASWWSYRFSTPTSATSLLGGAAFSSPKQSTFTIRISTSGHCSICHGQVRRKTSIP